MAERKEYFLYLLHCADGSFYTGIAADLQRRLEQHCGLRPGGAKYTRTRRPVTLAASWRAGTKSGALKAEYALKRLSHAEKEHLAAGGGLPEALRRILENGGRKPMTRKELMNCCLSFPDAYEDYPFSDGGGADGAWTVMRHRGDKRVFALIYERDGLCINLKSDPMQSDFLRKVYRGVTPGYHMNKQHWNTVRPDSDVPPDELREMIRASWLLTLPKRSALRRNFEESGPDAPCGG